MDTYKNVEFVEKLKLIKLPEFCKKMDFENFMVSRSNKKAVKTVKRLMERRPGYKAVLIYGERMCGKTHLAKAVWTELLAREQDVVMRDVDHFTEELQGWLWAGGTLEGFYENYEKR
jgi:chromosomal replication initiation ATPase DnaA